VGKDRRNATGKIKSSQKETEPAREGTRSKKAIGKKKRRVQGRKKGGDRDRREKKNRPRKKKKREKTQPKKKRAVNRVKKKEIVGFWTGQRNKKEEDPDGGLCRKEKKQKGSRK